MSLIVYGTELSPPCRAVYMVAEALGITIEKREVSIIESHQHKPEFLKINPLNTIPVLDYNGTILVDSHAILTYLVEKFGNNSHLYPKDIEVRSQINSKLYFNADYVFNGLKSIVRSYFIDGQNGLLKVDQKQQIINTYNYSNILLENKDWLVGENVTVADIALFSTITSLNIILPIDIDQYGNLSRWLKNNENLSFSYVNTPGLEIFKEIWKEKNA